MSILFDSKATTVKIQDVYSIAKVIITSVKMKELHGVIILKTDDIKHAYKYGDKYLIVLFNNNENADVLIKLIKEECLRHGIEYIEL